MIRYAVRFQRGGTGPVLIVYLSIERCPHCGLRVPAVRIGSLLGIPPHLNINPDKDNT